MKIKKFKRGKWWVLESGQPKQIFDNEYEADVYMGNLKHYVMGAPLDTLRDDIDDGLEEQRDMTYSTTGTTFEGEEEVDFGEPFEDV